MNTTAQQFDPVREVMGQWPSAQLPAVLLPVRLETRFVFETSGPESPEDRGELRVRIYPDDLHIDSHDPALTEVERRWGCEFWAQCAQSGWDEETGQAAWRRLGERFTAERALWIAEALRPEGVGVTKGELVFPEVPSRKEVWSRAPVARALPTRWVLLGYRGKSTELVAWGGPVPSELAVGPSLDFQEPFESEPESEQLEVDDAMRWLVDFEEAEAVGMAIRVSLSRAEAERKLDTLVVLGLTEGEDEEALAELLRTKRHTDGFAFVPQGTPTNNTPAARAGYTTRPAEGDVEYLDLVERRPLGAASNATVTARALGVDPSLLVSLASARATEQEDAGQAATALWSATWGYYLTHLVEGLSLETLARLRTHFIEHVRARGPFPCLRVGRQPYGLLPVLTPGASEPATEPLVVAGFEALLQELRDLWRSANKGLRHAVPHQKPSASAVREIVSMTGLSADHAARMVLPGEMLGTPGLPADVLEVRKLVLGWMQKVGVQSVLSDLVLSEGFSLKSPFISSEPSADAASLTDGKANYLAALSAASFDELESDATLPSSEKSPPLLYLLARHSLRVEYAHAAFRIRLNAGNVEASDLRETAADAVGLGEHVRRATEEFGPDIFSSDDNASETRDLRAMKASLKYLGSCSRAVLDTVVREVLDLGSHRLDAWVTSLATARLATIRRDRPVGALIGGYGWVHSLALNPAAAPVAVADAPAGEEGGPLFERPGNGGFLHAPSLTHATTAAILRSGYRAHTKEDHPWAVDLSSARVRLARWLLDGVREGTSLGALLGYRVERQLQELGAARDVSGLREFVALSDYWLAPSAAKRVAILDELKERWDLPPTTKLQELLEYSRRRPLDGFQLHELCHETEGDLSELPWGRYGLPSVAASSHVKTALLTLHDTTDAVADVLTAENVHQIAQGNLSRAGSTLRAVALEDAPPPQLDIVRAPRTGQGYTHRLLVLRSSLDAATEPTGIRATCEPHLEAWSREVLGSPSRVRLVFEFLDLKTRSPAASLEIRLSELAVSSLDCVYLAEPQHAEGGDLGALLLALADRKRPPEAPSGSIVQIRPGRGADWPMNDISFEEFCETAATLRPVLRQARPLEPQDLVLPGEPAEAAYDTLELEHRADAGEAFLASAHQELEELLAPGRDSPLESIQAVLLRLCECSVGAVPGIHGTDRKMLLDLAQVALEECHGRRLALAELGTKFQRSGADADRCIAHDTKRLGVSLGQEFRTVPVFKLSGSAELETAFDASFSLQEGHPLQAISWLQRVSPVRQGAARLNASLAYAEALGLPDVRRLTVGQLPHEPGDHWLALETPRSGRLSLVVHGGEPPTMQSGLAGLMVDTWTEVIPSATEHTGIAFNYDAPGARPPQALLVAVPRSTSKGAWTLEALEATVLEAIDLSRLRAVDSEVVFNTPQLRAFFPIHSIQANLQREHGLATDFSTVLGGAPPPGGS